MRVRPAQRGVDVGRGFVEDDYRQAAHECHADLYQAPLSARQLADLAFRDRAQL
jgi:hypothetical protein